MKPSVQKIITKLTKDKELKKVDLSLVQDAEKLVREIKAENDSLNNAIAKVLSTNNQIQKLATELQPQVNDMKSTLDGLEAYASEITSITSRFKTSADELGMDYNKIPSVDKLQNLENVIKFAVKEVRDVNKMVSKKLKI